MTQKFGPAQNKALTLDAAAALPLVPVVLSAPYRGFRPGDVLEVTDGEADALTAGGVGARL